MSDVHPTDDALVAYALGDLDGDERAAVEAHLGECDGCSGAAASLISAMECVKTSPRPEAPARVLVDLLESQAAARASSIPHRWRLAAVAMVGAAVLLAAFFLTGFWAGRHTAPDVYFLSPQSEQGASLLDSLPEPPRIPFQSAGTMESM